jgi:hypothetical protein
MYLPNEFLPVLVAHGTDQPYLQMDALGEMLVLLAPEQQSQAA